MKKPMTEMVIISKAGIVKDIMNLAMTKMDSTNKAIRRKVMTGQVLISKVLINKAMTEKVTIKKD